jgi:putative DNA primase/helicase
MDTIQFLTELYGSCESGWLTLWTKQDKRTAWINVTNHQLIADTADSVEQDIYFGVGISSQRKPEGRLSADDVTAIPGLWIDIDIAGVEHKQNNLPARLSEATEFMNSLPFEPTIIVDSGHGLHAYWLFREIWEFDTPEERNQGKGLLKGFQDFIRSRATARGWKLDATHDLSRVLRLPGTTNYKTDPVPVTVISHNDNRFNPSDFEQYAAAIATVEKRDKFKRNPSDGPAAEVINNCKFMQVCRDHAHELSEPQWVAMLSNISRCSDGPEVCHELSRPYAGYSEQETADKIFHVLNNMNPQTCQYIRESLQFPMCPEGGCGVKSPCGWALAKSKKLTVEETLDKPVPDGFFDVDTDATGIDKFTDLGNAERFAKMFKGQLQYCKQMGKWLIWNGSRWERDNSDQVMTYAKKCIRSMYVYAAGVDDPIFRKAILKHANSSESLKSIKSMITIAQSELPVALHDLDADQWILNCTNGIVNLKTGELMPHDPAKNCTKMSPATFSQDAECPVFESFIHSTFDGNENIIKFMQRLLGYCTTGETREQQFAIAFGSGRNGKGTLLNLVLDIMGDYAQTTPTDTLYRKKNEGVSNDIARLMGARFVLASEGEEGKRFDEPLIKKMTGQDRMAARFLHQEFFEFMPQFKLMLMTNDKPIARGDDAALWSRIQLIPFTKKFEGSKKDDTLKDKLRTPAEMSGILSWLIAGCLEWQRAGLNPPEEVIQATAEYRNESDKFQTWIDECCVVEEYAVSSSYDLYKSFQSWSLSNGDKHIVTSIVFGKQLTKKGFEGFRGTGGARKFKGIGLLAEHAEEVAKESPY